MATDAALAGPDTIRLELPASYKYLGVLGACVAELLTQLGEQEDAAGAAFAVQLAVQEVCTNIVEHAYADRPDGRISGTLTLAGEPRRLIVELLDDGRPFDPAAVLEPDLEQAHEGGYGLLLVRSMVDEVSYARRDDRNCWRLVKRV